MDSARKELPFDEEIEAENGFVELIMLDASILIDIKYATTDNFVKEKMYNCGRCFLRPEVAAAIVLAHKKLQKKGLGLKIFDGYRPRPFQQRLWDKVPDDRYVTNPKKGSMHNRGAAVDLTIVDKKGKELDMGTAFDFFGEKAYQTCTDLPKNVLENRKLLRETLAEFGFNHIRTEWWHYSYTKKKYALSDWLWECK
jgi:D-alanyl-D-alanine dipeptidase